MLICATNFRVCATTLFGREKTWSFLLSSGLGGPFALPTVILSTKFPVHGWTLSTSPCEFSAPLLKVEEAKWPVRASLPTPNAAPTRQTRR